MELIKFDNVSFSYQTTDEKDNPVSIPVLKDFNLSIEQGSFVAILGHNGSGKSTVAKITNGILFADDGTVTVNGKVAKNDDSICNDTSRKIIADFNSRERRYGKV